MEVSYSTPKLIKVLLTLQVTKFTMEEMSHAGCQFTK